MNQVFRHPIKVTQSDIDAMGHVNNVVYVRWVQEVAAGHWDAIATPWLKQNFKWVVLRHEIDYKSPAYLGDEIVGTTWVSSASGVRSDRHVQLHAVKDGRLLAEAKTTWCMIDANTGKPARITSEVLDVL